MKTAQVTLVVVIRYNNSTTQLVYNTNLHFIILFHAMPFLHFHISLHVSTLLSLLDWGLENSIYGESTGSIGKIQLSLQRKG